MTKYQLWSRDEYGQGSILFTSEDLEEVVKKGKQEVTTINVANALTTDDREKNWEAYMVMVGSTSKGRTHKRYVYSGSNPRTTQNVFGVKKDGSVDDITLKDIPALMVRIYLGDVSTKRGEEKDWYANDARRNVIDKIDHPDLDAKTRFFVSKVEVG
jgi:hypothetical protein